MLSVMCLPASNLTRRTLCYKRLSRHNYLVCVTNVASTEQCQRSEPQVGRPIEKGTHSNHESHLDCTKLWAIDGFRLAFPWQFEACSLSNDNKSKQTL